MKIATATIVLLILSLLAANCSAQSASSSRFQSVGGDYARTWLNALTAQNPQNSQTAQTTQTTQTNQNAQATQSESGQKKSSGGDLWSWGSAPKGSRIVGGELVADPYYLWPRLNYTYNWLGDSNMDPNAGRPLYSYTDPKTRETVYGYWDPTTGKMIPASPESWQALFPGDQPYYTGGAYPGGSYPGGSYSGGAYPGSMNGAGLPSVFSTNDPWA